MLRQTWLAPWLVVALTLGGPVAVVADDDEGDGDSRIPIGVGELYSIHNLVENPSFEQHSGIQRKRSKVFASLPG